MTDPMQTEREATLEEVLEFLYGFEELDGCWYGSGPPAGKGRYWWRSKLRAAIKKQSDELRSLRDALALAKSRIAELEGARSAVALDIARWFVNGDRPDEWKLQEWVVRLDRDAVAKAYEERSA